MHLSWRQDGGSKPEPTTLASVLRWLTALYSPPSSRTRHVYDCRGQTVFTPIYVAMFLDHKSHFFTWFG